MRKLGLTIGAVLIGATVFAATAPTGLKDVYPVKDNFYGFGTASKRWFNAYIHAIFTDRVQSSGTNDLVIATDTSGNIYLSPGGGASHVIIQDGTQGVAEKALVSGGTVGESKWSTLKPVGGGTGLATLTAHSLQVGNGTGNMTQIGVGATGTILKGTSASDPSFTATPVLGASGTTGTLGFSGTTSGTVTVQPQSVAGTYNFNLPTTAGSSGDVLTSGGGGSAAMTWTAALTNPMTTANDLIIGGTAGASIRLGVGAAGTIPMSYGAGTGNPISWTVAYAAKYTTTAGGTLTASTDNRINFLTSVFDSNANVTTGASWAYNAPYTGYYHVYAQVHVDSLPSAQAIVLKIFKNSAVLQSLRNVQNFRAATTDMGISIDDIVSLTAGDTIYATINPGGGGTVTLDTTTGINFIAINLIH